MKRPNLTEVLPRELRALRLMLRHPLTCGIAWGFYSFIGVCVAGFFTHPRTDSTLWTLIAIECAMSGVLVGLLMRIGRRWIGEARDWADNVFTAVFLLGSGVAIYFFTAEGFGFGFWMNAAFGSPVIGAVGSFIVAPLVARKRLTQNQRADRWLADR